MRDEDEEDFIFYGTPIEREEDTSNRRKNAIAEAGQLRSLPAWKQEVRDEEGRRRFHGAFTGGYSAGYYNTAGSKEGWTPQTFTSSRKSRAEVKQQSVYSFLDDEDIKDLGGNALETSSQFDTFGFTAAEVARKQVEKEQHTRPSAIPGPVPDEIVLPAANSIGVRLLLKMGWRHGHSISETRAGSLYGARREARKAFLAFSGNEGGSEISQTGLNKTDPEDNSERHIDGLHASQSTPVYVLYPKQDLHGLGFDPFKHAPEFRDRKRSIDSRNKGQGNKTNVSTRDGLLSSNSGKYAPGFGIGALEELDVEDEDIYASGFEFVATEVEEDEPSREIIDNKRKIEFRKQDAVPGFKVASSSDYSLERFLPPVIPPDFKPFHKFTSSLETVNKFAEAPPPEVPPPDDNSLRVLIEGFATLVARCGKLFEDLSKEKNRSNPLFSFLSGGDGYNYYARKLWEAKQKNVDQQSQVDTKSSYVQKMTAESRGKILGEKPLQRSSDGSALSVPSKEVIHLQSNLTDTFTKPASLVGSSESAKPFKDDPARQERFEQFLKDKYQGGLRSTSSGGTSIISETDRARERLDFEAAADAIEKGKWDKKTSLPSAQQFMEILGTADGRFVSSTGEEKHQNSLEEEKIYPKREEFQWRPSPILCKRFDLIDPFMGKPPPLPRARSKMDSFIFLPDSTVNVKSEETSATRRDSLSTTLSEPQETGTQPATEESDVDINATNVQRPVDLYKAIFSDDSDDEGDNGGTNKVEYPEKKIEGVNTTLNRLVAGDFLESLGKELGLEVPQETSFPPNKTNSFPLLEETVSREEIKTSSRSDKSVSMIETFSTHLEDKETTASLEIAGKGAGTKIYFRREESNITDMDKDAHDSFSHHKEGKVKADKKERHGRKLGAHSRRHQSSSTSTDDSSSDHKGGKVKADKKELRSRKHGSHSRHLQSSSTSDSDSPHRYFDHSKSKSEKRTSSKRKSRKYSDHHRSKRSRSPTRYSSHDNDRGLSDDSRKDRTSRDREKHSRRKYR